jgi:hypothetical protein
VILVLAVAGLGAWVAPAAASANTPAAAWSASVAGISVSASRPARAAAWINHSWYYETPDPYDKPANHVCYDRGVAGMNAREWIDFHCGSWANDGTTVLQVLYP